MRELAQVTAELITAYENLLTALDEQGPAYCKQENDRVQSLLAELETEHGIQRSPT